MISFKSKLIIIFLIIPLFEKSFSGNYNFIWVTIYFIQNALLYLKYFIYPQ